MLENSYDFIPTLKNLSRTVKTLKKPLGIKVTITGNGLIFTGFSRFLLLLYLIQNVFSGHFQILQWISEEPVAARA